MLPCLSPGVMHRGRTRVSDGGGYLSTAIALKQKTGKLPQPRVLSPLMEEPR